MLGVSATTWKLMYLHQAIFRITAIVALTCFIVVNAVAQIERVDREVAGRGADSMAAIWNALQEATFQICGVRVQSSLDVKSTQIEDEDGLRMTDRVNRDIQASTGKRNCEIDGYDVLGITGDGASSRATLRVHYTIYKVPGPRMERRRIAVLDFPMEDIHLYGVGGERRHFRNVRNLETEFRHKIEELLTQGRRFGVLDRTRTDVYEAEKRFLQSEDVDPGERARLGQVIGADYLLYGVVDRIIVEDQSKIIEISGERISRLLGTVEVRFTIMALATRQIKWTSSISLDQEFDISIPPERVAASVLDAVATAMVGELTENIYPPKVTAVVTPGQFILNRGGNTVSLGDLFEVFSAGEALIDPDTGEPLDRVEISVGIAQIVDVKPKYSIARLISGYADLSRGMTLRRRPMESGKLENSFDHKSTFKDTDGDGLPDYLNRQ